MSVQISSVQLQNGSMGIIIIIIITTRWKRFRNKSIHIWHQVH